MKSIQWFTLTFVSIAFGTWAHAVDATTVDSSIDQVQPFQVNFVENPEGEVGKKVSFAAITPAGVALKNCGGSPVNPPPCIDTANPPTATFETAKFTIRVPSGTFVPGGGTIPAPSSALLDEPPGNPKAGKVSTAADVPTAVGINGWNQGELYSFHPGVCNVALGDGSVRGVHIKRIPEKTLKALFTRNGGEVIDPNDW